MHKFFFILILFTSLTLYANEALNWEMLTVKEQGIVIESSGHQNFGEIEIQPCRNRVIIHRADSTIKIDIGIIKRISKKSVDVQLLYFNDSIDFYFGQFLDTIHTLKFYKGYNCDVSMSFGSFGTVGAMASGIHANYMESYIVSIDGNQAVNFSRNVKGLNFLEIDNYKKKLLKAFGENPKIVTYLNGYKKVRFDDIPTVVSYINSVY